MEGTCQCKRGWVSCIFGKIIQISLQIIVFPVLCFNISETILPFEQLVPHWLEHCTLMSTWQGGDPTSPVRASKPWAWRTPAPKEQRWKKRKGILIINFTSLVLNQKWKILYFLQLKWNCGWFFLLSLLCYDIKRHNGINRIWFNFFLWRPAKQGIYVKCAPKIQCFTSGCAAVFWLCWVC